MQIDDALGDAGKILQLHKKTKLILLLKLIQNFSADELFWNNLISVLYICETVPG